MSNNRVLLVLLTAFLLGCSNEDSPEVSDAGSKSSKLRIVDLSSNNAQVHSNVRAFVRASYERDIPTILKYTHPKIIAAMGGRAQAEATLESTFAKIGPMTLESFTFPEAPTYLETDRNYYVIIPTLSVVSRNGQQAESLNFQFGHREKTGDDWKYVEGSRINQGNVRSFFPDFPTDFEFPEVYRKKI